MKNTFPTKKLVYAAVLAAISCVATIVIKLPSPQGGYFNLGDGAVLLSGALLGPLFGALAAGAGSAAADILSGFALYAPATFIIKALMALLFSLSSKAHPRHPLILRVLLGTGAELIMVFGYLCFESVLYGFVAALSGVFSNAAQAVIGLIVSVTLVTLFEKNNIAPLSR